MRPPNEDRENVTSKGGPSIGIRLTPAENTALEALLELQRAKLESAGVAGVEVTGAGYMRGLLRREAEAAGVWQRPPQDTSKTISALETACSLAVEADADPRTVARWLCGGRVRGRVGARIVATAERMGFGRGGK